MQSQTRNSQHNFRVEFKSDQRVEVVQERGTRRVAYVQGVTRGGKVIIQYQDDSYDIVDREDIES